MQFEWKILSMDCYPSVGDVINVVYKVSWKATAVDGDHIAVITGSTDVGDPSSDNYISYDDLSETIVLGWLFDSIEADKVQIEDSLKTSVNMLKNPSSVRLHLPWQETIG